jgi:peptide chain release factor 1
MVSGQRLNNCAPDLRAADIKYSTHRGTGKGGQHQNTTDSAVRATHIPTGLHISIQGRSQVANKREGAKLLAQQVFAQHGTQSNQHAAHLKRQQYTQGSKVRTWNYIENRVIDHTTNSKHSLKGFIKSARIPQLKK